MGTVSEKIVAQNRKIFAALPPAEMAVFCTAQWPIQRTRTDAETHTRNEAKNPLFFTNFLLKMPFA